MSEYSLSWHVPAISSDALSAILDQLPASSVILDTTNRVFMPFISTLTDDTIINHFGGPLVSYDFGEDFLVQIVGYLRGETIFKCLVNWSGENNPGDPGVGDDGILRQFERPADEELIKMGFFSSSEAIARVEKAVRSFTQSYNEEEDLDKRFDPKCQALYSVPRAMGLTCFEWVDPETFLRDWPLADERFAACLPVQGNKTRMMIPAAFYGSQVAVAEALGMAVDHFAGHGRFPDLFLKTTLKAQMPQSNVLADTSHFFFKPELRSGDHFRLYLLYPIFSARGFLSLDVPSEQFQAQVDSLFDALAGYDWGILVLLSSSALGYPGKKGTERHRNFFSTLARLLPLFQVNRELFRGSDQFKSSKDDPPFWMHFQSRLFHLLFKGGVPDEEIKRKKVWEFSPEEIMGWIEKYILG